MAKKILLIAGTRPNFIKLAPLYHKLRESGDGILVETCHTGQHFDSNMSDVFWDALELPQPDYMLNVKGGDVPDTIGKSIIGINKLMKEKQFDLVCVFGDVNATVAGAIVAAQSDIDVMHIEAGLRSNDKRMPEETNRVITDHISDYLMVSEPSGLENLQKEGIPDKKVHYVGNIMIESLIKTRPKWERIQLDASIESAIVNPFVLCTFHRPENVDNETNLSLVIELLLELATDRNIILPLHPRTKNKLAEFDLETKLSEISNLLIVDPLPYFEFVKLLSLCDYALTDSGGIQEESSYFGTPCITVRNNTERPVTITTGTNKLVNIVGKNLAETVKKHVDKVKAKPHTEIELWDSMVSSRIAEVILSD